ncbi:glycosyltransferase family 2 protein [Pseudoclavibacter sp. RFBA6]|uniref:glycosyltransferase n=1 Tax=Pseudoclavibacter sp. RFBA6 TaxID=2080573 RepID=UPI0015E1CFDA|nr:glycosyltransferase family 2 protein [Pseudoclavibacter sp. RFBA6]
MPSEFAILLTASLLLITNANALGWMLSALSRTIRERRTRLSQLGPRRLARIPGRGEVAILIAAHNESLGIRRTVRSAHEHVPLGNVFVASDGSTDSTSAIAAQEGAKVLDISPNRGKAGALSYAITEFGLAERFDVVMLLDADTVLSPDYMDTALPLFMDEDVVAVAGMARTAWTPKPSTAMGELLVTHRDRMYIVMQYFLKFGMAARTANAVPIVPGFASLYKTRILDRIDIEAPGLVIEDFNMTFEVHAKRLGRIAFDPRTAVAYTQDPDNLGGYVKQVKRWNLGFWQTLRRHPHLPWRFRIFMIGYVAELTLSATLIALVPLLIVASAVVGIPSVEATLPLEVAAAALPAWFIVAAYYAADVFLTLVAFVIGRRVEYLRWLPLLPLLRFLDAMLCLQAGAKSVTSKNDGRWHSPTRR